jgi:hypothetical protein
MEQVAGKGWVTTREGQHILIGKGGGGGGRSFGSKKEATEYLNGNEGLNPTLSSEEDEALEWYKGEGFDTINQDMRNAGYSEDDRADFIEATLARGKTTTDMTVWRGLDSELEEFEGDMTGAVFSDAAFLSTSLVEGVASAHSDGLVMEIRVPKGTPAINMERWGVTGWAEGEAELLLKNGLNFRVISDSGEWDDRQMVVEVVP